MTMMLACSSRPPPSSGGVSFRLSSSSPSFRRTQGTATPSNIKNFSKTIQCDLRTSTARTFTSTTVVSRSQPSRQRSAVAPSRTRTLAPTVGGAVVANVAAGTAASSSAPGGLSSLLPHLPQQWVAALPAHAREFAFAGGLSLFALLCLPSLAKKLWELMVRINPGHTDITAFLIPVRAFSVQDAALGATLRRRARELVRWETSILHAAVLPMQFAVLAAVAARLLVVTGLTEVLHVVLFAREGSLVAACRLPWPAYVAAAWYFMDRAVTRVRTRLLGAVESVGGTGARTLEPRIETGANTVKTALGVPMFLLFLDSIGVTLSAVWGLLGFGGVAVSFGMKDIVSDFIAGLMMLTNPTFKVGDSIKAGNIQGTVMGIGATKTTLLTRTGTGKTPHTISNGVLSSQATGVVNMSLARARYFDHQLCFKANGGVAAVAAVCADIKAYLDGHPDVIHDPMDGGDRAWCALESLGPGGVLVGVKCTLRKMGSQVFALEQGRMLVEIGELVEAAEGVSLKA